MKSTTDALVEALEEITSLADRVDGWESFPRGPIEKAEAALALARAEQAEPVPAAWRVRLRAAPDYWIIFLHKPVDALKDPSREVQPLYTTPPAPVPQPVQTVEPWMVHAKQLTQWRHCMSYNDSYFGEPAGLVKQITAELERLIPATPVKAAAAPPPPKREPLTDAQIDDWWRSENGLEDCVMSKQLDFRKVVRAIEAAHGITPKEGG